jgi:hypothetical protein
MLDPPVSGIGLFLESHGRAADLTSLEGNINLDAVGDL